MKIIDEKPDSFDNLIIRDKGGEVGFYTIRYTPEKKWLTTTKNVNTLENYTGNIKVFNPEGIMLADVAFAKGTNVAAGTFMYNDCGDPIDIDH